MSLPDPGTLPDLSFLLDQASKILPVLLALLSSGALVIGSACYVIYSQTRTISSSPPGCRRLGLVGKSNLADEFKKVATTEDSQQWKVKSLWVYPIKSGRGVELAQSDILSSGLQYDRLFCLAQLRSQFPVPITKAGEDVEEDRWQFVTQRKNPRLALLETELWVPDPTLSSYSPQLPEARSSGVLIVKYPDEAEFTGFSRMIYNLLREWGVPAPTKSFRIPITPTEEQLDSQFYEEERVEIWRDRAVALNMSRHLPDDLGYNLGISNRLGLFRISPRRPEERIILRNAPRKEELGYQPTVQFGDAFPLNLQNLASIQDVASHPEIRRAIAKLSVVRFRANIIITGPEAYDEEEWKRVKIGIEDFHVACRCARCILPNVDPKTGLRDREPFKSMRTFRAVDQGAGTNACLGMQLVPARVGGCIRVGDSLEVQKRGEHVYISI